jgi:hypothetical protein
LAQIVVDASRVPLIVVTYPDACTLEDYEQLFERYAALAKQHKRLAWLIDFSRHNPVTAPAALRQGAARIFEQHRATLTRVSVCESRIVQNPLARGVLIAFDWLTPNKWPCGNFASRAEAEAFCQKHLAREALAPADKPPR